MKSFNLPFRSRVYFEEDIISILPRECESYNNILLVYGQESIKKNGLYEQVINLLETKNIYELSGITPNPKLTDVYKGIDICKTNNIDLILAIGGGSVIDASKAISIGSKSQNDIWEIITKRANHNDAIDIATIPTMIATGSETNDIFVIYNDLINLKRSLKSNVCFPQFCIMNSKYTTTIPKRHTINGIVDTLSHLFEQYINETDNYPLDEIIISLFASMVETGKLLVNDLESEKLRSDHMFIAMYGYNGDFRSIVGGDWACHGMDYGLASLFNNFHGEGLSVITHNWLTYTINNDMMSNYLMSKVIKIFDSCFKFEKSGNLKSDALNATESFKMFLQAIGAPTTFAQIGITFNEDKLNEMVEKSQFVKPLGQTINLSEKDIKSIYIKGAK